MDEYPFVLIIDHAKLKTCFGYRTYQLAKRAYMHMQERTHSEGYFDRWVESVRRLGYKVLYDPQGVSPFIKE